MHVITEDDISNKRLSSDIHSKKYSNEMKKLDDLNISNFDILLADVEGKEYELLKGGKNKIIKYKPIIIVEIWNNNKRNLERMQTTTDEIINYIINLGYKLTKQLGDNYIFLPKDKKQKNIMKINRTVSVAPMMDCTDRHERFFLRLMSKNVMLYTEMVATKSAIHGDRKKILGFNKIEKPLALQVGGSNQKELIEVCKIAEDMGYDEININLGCPSKKVQKNKFGACLIKEPELVADCINNMVNNCKIPVTAKTRIGFDNTETFEYLNSFVNKNFRSWL